MRRHLPLAGIVIAGTLLVATTAQGQARPDSTGRIQIALLGTFHFGASSDSNRTLVPDLLGPARQAELAGVRAALARWEPTRVFVEHEPSRQAHWDSLTAAYRAGSAPVGNDLRNEIFQIGVRLAVETGLRGVTCIDYQIPDPDAAGYAPRSASEADYAQFLVRAYGRLDSLGKTNETFFYRRGSAAGPSRDAIAGTTIGAYLRAMNEPAALRASDYAEFNYWALAAGTDEEHAGADFVANYWISRNVKIYQNLLRGAGPGGGRYLVVVGASHVQILTNWLLSHPAFEVVEARALLADVR